MQQTEDMQTFLLQTSILERLNAGLCEAVTGCQDGQAALKSLLPVVEVEEIEKRRRI